MLTVTASGGRLLPLAGVLSSLLIIYIELTAVTAYDRVHAENGHDRPLDYGFADREWRRRSADYILMLVWQSFALLFTYPAM